MNEPKYVDFVLALCKPGEQIQKEITVNDAIILNASSEIFIIAGHVLEFADTGSMIKSPHHAHIGHMAIGIAGEAGELIDAVKKFVVYRKELDRKNVIEELGDLWFYIVGYVAFEGMPEHNSFQNQIAIIVDYLGITMIDVIKANREKLSKRYGSLSYSNEAAIARNDKIEITASASEAPLSAERIASLQGTIFKNCKTEAEITAMHFEYMA